MAVELVCYCDGALVAMETIYIPVQRLLRFARSDNRQTVIAMERLLRQKQSPCLGGRLLRFARTDNRQTVIAMER